MALTNWLLSERLLLLYSPSGAGKTSIIQARGGLRDRMVDEGFHLLPIVRVSHNADVAAKSGVNRYLLSTLVSLELARPTPDRRTAEEHASLLQSGGGELALDFLGRQLTDLVNASAAGGDGGPAQPFLVFDQFRRSPDARPHG